MMIDKIVEMIIREAKSRRDMDITDSLLEVQTSVTLIICRLSARIRNIQKQTLSDQEKETFIQHLLEHPF